MIWAGGTHRVGQLIPAQRGAAVSFLYAPEWLARGDAFSIDPTGLPLRAGPQHSPELFGAIPAASTDLAGLGPSEVAFR